MLTIFPPLPGSSHFCTGWVKRLWGGAASPASPSQLPPADASLPGKLVPADIVEGDDQQAELVRRFLGLGRAALLLRPAVAQSIAEPYLAAIHQVLQEEMVWTADGDVALVPWSCEADDSVRPSPVIEHVTAFHFDRCLVTNRRFHEFVSHGGYAQEAVWDPAIWPRVGEFCDRTDKPGPRYWQDGTFPREAAEEPVVGVSWYEADAFARWCGKRLPSDAEWVKVAACPSVSPGNLVQRRFPWGDVWDPSRANLWVCGLGKIAPVDQFAEGNSASGVRQLLGNVWEWTSSDVRAMAWGKEMRFETPLKSLRGGAFDTYFENQATSQLQSGDSPIVRRHNVGFRCALSSADIVGPEPAP